jgi:L-threonylcarbamoyladenylate synthase
VIDLTTRYIKILRPGIIQKNEINKTLGFKISNLNKNKKIKSPGLLKKHYSPGIPMKLNQKHADYSDAFIIIGKKYKNIRNTFNLSKKSNLKEAAKNLYKIFRKIKKLKYKKICVVKIPSKGVGVAINDRLKRASN